MTDPETKSPQIRVTVTIDGNVVFVGVPGPGDTFDLKKSLGAPSRLICSIGDPLALLRRHGRHER